VCPEVKYETHRQAHFQRCDVGWRGDYGLPSTEQATARGYTVECRCGGNVPAEVHFTSDEVSAEMAQSVGAIPAAPVAAAKPVSSAPASPDSMVGPGAVEVRSYQVKLEGDVARGQFLTQLAGKDIYVTLAGHLGSQDGYVTFDPTEFKVGDLSIPVSLVNSALQKKLLEQRNQLKLPDGVGSLRVENGELVITQK